MEHDREIALRENIQDLRASLVDARTQASKSEALRAELQEANRIINRLVAENDALLDEMARLRNLTTELRAEKEQLTQVIEDATEYAAARGRVGVLKILRR